MLSDAALAIIVSGSVGISGVGASIYAVRKSTSAQDRRERIAVRRDVYARFWSIQIRVRNAMIRFRSIPEEEEMKAVSRLLAELTEVHGELQLAGGLAIGGAGVDVINELTAYHDVSLSGTQPPDTSQATARLVERQRKLYRMMRADLGESDIQPSREKQPGRFRSLITGRDRKPSGGDQ